MYIVADTLDDVLHRVLSKLLKSRARIKPSRGGAVELTGVLLQLTNPRARLSRTETRGRLFSALGEFWWYLAKTNSLRFISYYVPRYREESDDGRSVYGGYGPRFFDLRGNDQIANVTALLTENSDSRRAVIQLFDACDIAEKHKNIPCTCTLQLLVRNGRLLMFTNMRSNDAFLGVPHDIFAFTMIQEIIARSLSIEPGTYTHAVGSLHLYDTDRVGAKQYLKEAWQSTVPMPPMPSVNPWPSIRTVLGAERALRHGRTVDLQALRLAPYWSDMVRLLQVYRYYKNDRPRCIARLKSQMSVAIYDPYIEEKQQVAHQRRAKAKSE